MGDRGNIVVQESKGNRVYLYGHWSGWDMPEILRKALSRGDNRWDDPQYLARIIFCEMISGRDMTETTGFGITSRLHDNQHPIIVVDCEKGEIRLEAEEDGNHAPEKPQAWKIADFAALVKASWSDLDKAREDA